MVELIWDNKKEMLEEVNSEDFLKTDKHFEYNREESKNFDTTENLYIEGDNLDALKLLQKNYQGKIKMIYIDPPYNTEKKFIYNDTFRNKRKKECRHSGWLNMMYPRLKLARDWLKDDGVIFISIDDNEVDNLKKVCNEIFGEQNFVGDIIWQTATDNNPSQIAIEHEYIICYAKCLSIQPKWLIASEKALRINKRYLELKEKYKDDLELIHQELKKWIKKNENTLKGVTHYTYVDNKGVYYPGNSSNTKPGGYDFNIIHPVTKKVCKKPQYGYRWTEQTFLEADKRGDVEWGIDETTIPKIKKRIETVTQMLKSYYYEDSRYWTKYINSIFGRRVFENPKSVNLLKYISNFVTCNNDIVLDFFSGSSSTAHAVMQLNAEDKGNRKFIMVQLPEKCSEKSEAFKAGYKNICEIGKERIRRAGDKIVEENKDKDGIEDLDIGFKVIKIK